MYTNIPNVDELECGDIIYHVLGMKLSVIKITTSTRGKGLKKKIIKMVKCRYLHEGHFHIFEFFPNELRKAA